MRRPRKSDIEGADVTCCGRLFQVRAAATGKVRSPTVNSRERRTLGNTEEAELGEVAQRLDWTFTFILSCLNKKPSRCLDNQLYCVGNFVMGVRGILLRVGVGVKSWTVVFFERYFLLTCFNAQPPTDRQADITTMPIADHTAYSTIG